MRPCLRRGRLAHLDELDRQRPRVRLERMAPPRRERDRWDALVFVWCVAGGLLTGLAALVARGCS